MEQVICKTTNKPLITTKQQFWELYASGSNFQNYSMIGLDLSSEDYSGISFRGMNMAGVNLSYAILTCCDLSTSHFSGANFELAELQDANMEFSFF